MKMINFKLLLIAITVYLTLSGCGKEESHPLIIGSGGGGGGSSPQVISSDWFSANWETNSGIHQFVKTAPELTTDILTKGIVLVFGRGGYAGKRPTILPASFDGNFIAEDMKIDAIRFVLEGSGTTSPTLMFRYILIPANQQVSDGKLDYQDYDAVCVYYQIAK